MARTDTETATGAIAVEAGALLKERFGRPGEIRSKALIPDQQRAYDVVTEVDFASEKLILERIREVAPGSVVLAEEGGISLSDEDSDKRLEAAELADADDLWIVDPLDGTINFAHSNPGFAVSIARYSKGSPVSAAIYDPLLDELFSYERGDVMRLNGEERRMGAVTDPSECLLGLGSAGRIFPETVRSFRAWRRIGSAALMLAYTACGRFDAYVTLGTLSPWDHAAGVAMILAAGGVVTEPDFAPWSYPLDRPAGVIAANAGVHDWLKDQLHGI